MTGRCTARGPNCSPAPRCIYDAGHGVTAELGRVAHVSDEGWTWLGPGAPCPCGHEEDDQCECGVSRLAWAQRNEREDALGR